MRHNSMSAARGAAHAAGVRTGMAPLAIEYTMKSVGNPVTLNLSVEFHVRLPHNPLINLPQLNDP